MSKLKIKNSKILIVILFCFGILLFLLSLLVGKFDLSLRELLNSNELHKNVFFTLRVPRTVACVVAGTVLSVSGYAYQTVFKNPLASPDIIGVASGASSGAAFAILFLSSTAIATTVGAFAGGMIAVTVSLAICSAIKSKSTSTIVLAGVAVNAFFQMILMVLKLSADPEKQLASIEYWIMGSLNAITVNSLIPMAVVGIACVILLFALHRQILLLSYNSEEAELLGVNVPKMRRIVLIVSTLAVATVISATGLISFVGLIAPHIARMLMKTNKKSTMFCSALVGVITMLAADIFARSVTESELPLSIFTSLVGAPFLVYLLVRKKNYE